MPEVVDLVGLAARGALSQEDLDGAERMLASMRDGVERMESVVDALRYVLESSLDAGYGQGG